MTLDDWLDKHQRLSTLHWQARRHTIYRWQAWQSRRELKRDWTPGIAYLDHGYEPCVLIECDEWGGLTGVSMIDGRSVGGCSVFHCGPERVSFKEAYAVANVIKQMQTQRCVECGEV